RLLASVRLSHRRPNRLHARVRVLNAFWRQCGYHGRDDKKHKDRTAQCSTPFCGSGVINLAIDGRAAMGCTVVHAFLRECGYHNAIGPKSASRLAVLNAFWRQCGYHLGLPVKAGMMTVMCSTPFGVSAVITPKLTIEMIDEVVCSTPFGVSAVITSRMTV